MKTAKWLAAASAVAMATAFVVDVFSIQRGLCSIPIGQPGVSDFCGGLGLGGRPNREERMLWASRAPGNCSDIRNYVSENPTGFYREEAAALLASRESVVSSQIEHTVRELPVFLARGTTEGGTREIAERAAHVGAEEMSERLCLSFELESTTRLQSTEFSPSMYECSAISDRFTCSVSGAALCSLELTRGIESERCG